MSSSSPVTSFNFEARSQEAHTLWEGVFTVRSIYPKHQMHYILPKTDAGQMDNDDVDVKPDSTDHEDSPPNLSIGQRVVVQFGADIGCIG